MRQRTLGDGLTVSALGLGCMGMSSAYGPAADKGEMIKLISGEVSVSSLKGKVMADATKAYDPELKQFGRVIYL